MFFFFFFSSRLSLVSFPTMGQPVCLPLRFLASPSPGAGASPQHQGLAATAAPAVSFAPGVRGRHPLPTASGAGGVRAAGTPEACGRWGVRSRGAPQTGGGLGVAGPPGAGAVCEVGVVEGFPALFCVSVCVWGPLQRGAAPAGMVRGKGGRPPPRWAGLGVQPFPGGPFSPSSKAAVTPRVNF